MSNTMEWILGNSNGETYVPKDSIGTQIENFYGTSADCLRFPVCSMVTLEDHNGSVRNLVQLPNLTPQNTGISCTTDIGAKVILGEINKKLSLEDRTVRNFRRSIGFSETLKKDFIPILINVKDVEVIDAIIRILVNLSVPVECLLPIEIMSKSEMGRMTILELNTFLMSSKESFVDPRTTRVVIDYMKKMLEMEEKRKLSDKECDSINNCLLLLRNVLHIPEPKITSHCTIHNQIVWNLFVQNIDKVLIHLMTCEQKSYWGVTMVQLIAVMYKDQHVGTLQKLLNSWFEASFSESSEDNESNTSPPEQGSDSSPMLTSSDPTSDSSDTGGGRSKCASNHEGSSGVPHVTQRAQQSGTPECNKLNGKMFVFEESNGCGGGGGGTGGSCGSTIGNNTGGVGGGGGGGGGCTNTNDRKVNSQCTTRKSKISSIKRSSTTDIDSGAASLCSSETSNTSKGSSSRGQHNTSTRGKQSPDTQQQKRECFSPEMSDCGYGTQAENPELVSTSSNEEEIPQTKRPVHQKPHIQKTRYCNKQQSLQEKKEIRRKKLVKRSKTTIVNIKAMAHHIPTSEDITHILKEFTVDFLLKAYGSLVQVLYTQLLLSSNVVRVDTSHFFWLVTYFLKFAAQLELELEHIRDVLSYDIISYLTYEGVNICESLEIAARQETADLKPFLRRQHLVVTAIREFIQAIETYTKMSHLSSEDKEFLKNLQTQISSTDDLKCMFVLLLRQYNPNIHNKQYLQDLIVTNHILLSFLESSSKSLQNKFGLSLINHIKQFATVDVMRQYGILLEDFESNGEYINDCVFTMMHHIGGDMNQVSSLFQPNILKTFTQIWERDFQICDDWSDLIEYVIHRFINLSRHCPIPESSLPNSLPVGEPEWSQEECENLSWYFSQSSTDTDPISTVIKLYQESGVSKTRLAVGRRLLEQGVISPNQYRELVTIEVSKSSKIRFVDEDQMAVETSVEELNNLRGLSLGKENLNSIDLTDVDITQLTEMLIKDNRGAQLSWLQRLLIEVCYVKLVKDVNYKVNFDPITRPLEPIPHYYSHLNQSIPVVSWNSDQAAVLLLQPFQMLLHKLGFHLPADTGKVFARIPSFWTVDVLFSVAQKLGPIDSSDLKFELKYITEKFGEYKKQEKGNKNSVQNENHQFAFPRTKHHPCLIKYTPLPNSTCHWFDIVKQTKKSSSMDFIGRKPEENEPKTMSYLSVPRGKDDMVDSDIASVCSICETNRESVASDLTRMCMSDEEQMIPTQEAFLLQ